MPTSWLQDIKDCTFYQGINTETMQFIKTMCKGEFLSNDANEACEYLDSLTKNSQAWEMKDI